MAIRKKEKRIKKLFAILDVFNRDTLYRQCGVDLDFLELTKRFSKTLAKFKSLTSVQKAELDFDDYKDGITRLYPKCDPIHMHTITGNTSKSATVKSNLLFFATSQPIPSDNNERNGLEQIINMLIEKCPNMVKCSLKGKLDKDRSSGPTPVHVMIVKEANGKREKGYKRRILKKMLDAIDTLKDTNRTETGLGLSELKGELASGSVMRGKNILNIAVRTMDFKTVKMLLKRENFDCCNSYGDNMYHTLIRYAAFFPEKEQEINKTMRKISDFLESNPGNVKCGRKHWQGFPQRLWSMKNKERLTPLQLAAKLGRFEMFESIVKQKVYRINNRDKGNFDDDSYDITEIDTVPTSSKEIGQTKADAKIEGVETTTKVHHSVLHLLTQQSSDETTIKFVRVNVVGKTISEKWNHYNVLFRVWGFIHLLVMCLFAWQAIVRSRLPNPIPDASATSRYFDNVGFVIASSTITVIYGFLCILCMRRYCNRVIARILSVILPCWYRCNYHQRNVHSFEALFILFGLSMVVDYICFMLLPTYGNFILPFSVIIGWYLLMYFLHVEEPFSFFTVLIKNVLSDLLKFGVVLACILAGFSVAMYVAMQGAESSEEDDFQYVTKTFVKMFTVMLGIGEIGILFDARQPALAIIIFVLFVLMTTILLMNSLIAIMSNTCSKLTTETSRKAYVRLQRIKTIVSLEIMLPDRFRYAAGEESFRVWPGKDGSKTKLRRILYLKPDTDQDSMDLDDVESLTTEHDKLLDTITRGVDTLRHYKNKLNKTKPTWVSTITQPQTLDVQELGDA